MSSKPPKVGIQLGKINLNKFSAIALGVPQKNQKAKLPNSPLIKGIEKDFGINLTSELKKWPDYVAKSGEIIELPIATGNKGLIRIYLVGVGESKRDDYRKAGISIARKVKGSGQQVALAVVENRLFIENFVTSLILASYVWNQKTPKKDEKGAAEFVFIEKGKEFAKEINRGVELASGVWSARDLIHTPSNIKNPKWLADQAKRLVTATKNSALSIEIKAGSDRKSTRLNSSH